MTTEEMKTDAEAPDQTEETKSVIKKKFQGEYISSEKKIDSTSVRLTIGLSIIIGSLLSIPVFYFWGTLIGVAAVILLIAIITFSFFAYYFSNIQKVPEGYIWIIEFMGAFKDVWAPGGHMYFSFFHWMALREEIFLGEEALELFPDPNDLVDLDDTSCHFKAQIIVEVHNPLLAVYNIGDYKIAVANRVAGLLRSHLSKYTLDQANEEKHELDLDVVITGKKNEDYQKEKFYTEILNDWGVRLLKLVVEDLELSPTDIAQRQRKQDNEINLETAEVDRKIRVKKAEGEAEAKERLAKADRIVLEEEGAGIAKQIQDLVNLQEMSVEAATALIKERYKWSKIGDKALIIDSGNGSTAGEGAKFGAGMQKAKEINNDDNA